MELNTKFVATKTPEQIFSYNTHLLMKKRGMDSSAGMRVTLIFVQKSLGDEVHENKVSTTLLHDAVERLCEESDMLKKYIYELFGNGAEQGDASVTLAERNPKEALAFLVEILKGNCLSPLLRMISTSGVVSININRDYVLRANLEHRMGNHGSRMAGIMFKGENS